MTQFKYIHTEKKWFSSGLLFVWLLAAACTNHSGQSDKLPLFSAIDSSQTGITFVNHIKDSDKLNILDYLYFYNGGGVAAGDINNDQLTDIFFVSNSGKNQLYLNKGNWNF